MILEKMLEEIEIEVVRYNNTSGFDFLKKELEKQNLKKVASEILERLTISEILFQLDYETNKEDRFKRMNNLNNLRNLCLDILRN